MEDTEYYKWLNDALTRHGVVWSWITTEEQVKERVLMFKELVRSIKENGYQDELSPPLYVRNGNIYGEITVRAWEDGKYKLIDAHHRLSVMIALGYTEALVTICE